MNIMQQSLGLTLKHFLLMGYVGFLLFYFLNPQNLNIKKTRQQNPTETVTGRRYYCQAIYIPNSFVCGQKQTEHTENPAVHTQNHGHIGHCTVKAHLVQAPDTGSVRVSLHCIDSNSSNLAMSHASVPSD